jgi:hypothetical protein
MNASTLQRLTHLESLCDKHLFEGVTEEEKKKMKIAPGTVAATGAALYGANKVRKAYDPKTYTSAPMTAGQRIKGAARAAAPDVTAAAKAGAKGVKKVAGKVIGKVVGAMKRFDTPEGSDTVTQLAAIDKRLAQLG